MSEANTQAVPESFANMVKSFYGCTGGNIFSPVWICGFEWGGGHDPESPYPVSAFYPLSFEALHYWNGDLFRRNFWESKSPFCRAVIKLLMGLQDNGYKPNTYSSQVQRWQDYNLTGPNGLAMVLNTYPISFAGRNTAANSWENQYQVCLPDGSITKLCNWSHLESYEKYKGYVIDNRRIIYTAEREKRTPKVIICCGNERFAELWGAPSQVSGQFSSNDDGASPDCVYFWLDNGENRPETLLMRIPFPGYQLKADDQFTRITRKICELCKEKFGKDWLLDWSSVAKEKIVSTNENTSLTKAADSVSEGITLLYKSVESLTERIRLLNGVDEILVNINQELQENSHHLSCIDRQLQAECKSCREVAVSELGRLQELQDKLLKLQHEIGKLAVNPYLKK